MRNLQARQSGTAVLASPWQATIIPKRLKSERHIRRRFRRGVGGLAESQ
jgi:hypothetical protein